MRSKLLFFGAVIPLAALLTGCGMDTSQVISSDLASPAIAGRAFGGQMPITGGLVEVVSVGTAGYGSAGKVLDSTYTDSNGNFSFPAGDYACPQANTPVYVLAIGGSSGYGDNPAIVNAAGLGTCTNAQSSYVTVNEVTTAGLAIALANFFSPILGGYNAQNDNFGGPSTTSSGGAIQYAKGLVLGDDYTIPALVSNATGVPVASSGNVTVDSQKIATIANVLAACVNSNGETTKASSPCSQLFKYTTSASGQVPTDTLQAAVDIALNQDPTNAQMNHLFALGNTPTAPFSGLSAAPNDWSVGISYSTSTAGLGVDTGTVSTLDIDANGNVWFPSNAAGSTGAGYFDQTSRTFNGPFSGSLLVHPQQVAFDTVGNAWLNDSASVNVYSYNSASSTYTPYAIGALSTAIAVDSSGNTEIGTAGLNYGLGKISSGTYTPPVVTFAYPVASLASNNSASIAAATTLYSSTELNDYLVSGTSNILEISSKKDDSGQVIFTGNDFIATRPYSSGSGDAKDGICIYSQGACFNIKGGLTSSPYGITIDGGKNLWLSDSGDQSVIEIPINSASTGANGAVYLGANGKTVSSFSELLHGTGNGGTLTIPYGIGVDAEGNVWVSNATCNTTACDATTGGFTLTEIVGAGVPTITPVSAQIAGGANLVGTEPTQ